MTGRRSVSGSRLLAFVVGLAATVGLAVPVAAQDDDEPDSVSIPVVQALPGGDSERLNDALGRLGRNPRDFVALVDAGYAALGMGDSDAALGFLQRADALGPVNARVRAGIASAHLRKDDPFTAIPLFAEAEKIAPLDARAQMDRGLAYDMVGDNATAQLLYRAALAVGPNDEASRRLALSLAISGDKPAMEATLSPLLLRQDKVAWRTRAFSLAILGKTEEADAIARSALAPDQAVAMGAYLRYMPRLTPSQQAAAGNLGFFPRAADIGRDDPRVALYARPRAGLASADRQLVPSGQPLGRPATSSRIRDREDGRSGSRRRGSAPAAEKPPEVVSPGRAAAPPAANVELAAARPTGSAVTAAAKPATPAAAGAGAEPPMLAAAGPVPAPGPATDRSFAVAPARTDPATGSGAATAAAAAPALAAAGAAPGAATGGVRPAAEAMPGTVSSAPGFASLESGAAGSAAGFDLARAGNTPAGEAAATEPALRRPVPVAATPAAPPAVATVAPSRETLADLFADLSTPSREAVPQEGAVDIRTIAPTRPAATPRSGAAREAATTRGAAAPAKPGAAPAKPAMPSHPSRIWVQLATGRDKTALGFDWRRLTREDPDVFKGRRPLVSAFGQSNRLLTGPFESQAQANGFLAQLKKAGVTGAYVWTSPAGQVVDSLAVK